MSRIAFLFAVQVALAVELAVCPVLSAPVSDAADPLLAGRVTESASAFAILALVRAYQTLGEPRYLADAVTIGRWIYSRLLDPHTAGPLAKAEIPRLRLGMTSGRRASGSE